MLYTVQQVSNKLKVSKVTIYNKLKLKEYKARIIKKRGQAMIDDDLVNMIKDGIKFTTKFIDTDNIDTPIEPQNADNIILDEDVLNLNKELIKALLEQLHQKDKQMEEKDIQIAGLHKLIENNQVLLKEKPQKDILLLKEHFQYLNNKLIDIKEQMDIKEPKKGLLQKLFKI